MARLTVLRDEAGLADAAAERLTALSAEAIAARGTAVICLTGGSTPRRLYARLGDATAPWRERIDWARLHLFWGDERHVPPDDRDSNFGMARDTLLRHVPVPDVQIHRMRGEIPDARDAAHAYAAELRDGFAAAGRGDQTFDVMLLGLGEDAHIASLFPGSDLLTRSVEERRAAAVWAAHLHAWRITLTPAALLDARVIVMIVAGASKADAVDAALEAPPDVARYPAQLLRAAGDRLEWFMDTGAAARIQAR
jgi:6-phosphogluconolactonase